MDVRERNRIDPPYVHILHGIDSPRHKLQQRFHEGLLVLRDSLFDDTGIVLLAGGAIQH